MSDPLINVPIRDIDTAGRVVTIVRSFGDANDKIAHLARIVRLGAQRTDRFGVAPVAAHLGTIERAHAWVRDSIGYAEEPEEKLETAAYIAREGYGDCDGQAVLLATLVCLLGGSAILVPMGGSEDDPQHLSTLVRADGGSIGVSAWQPFGRRAPAGWTWAETTLRGARFGEIPFEAAKRLRAIRSDLSA